MFNSIYKKLLLVVAVNTVVAIPTMAADVYEFTGSIEALTYDTSYRNYQLQGAKDVCGPGTASSVHLLDGNANWKFDMLMRGAFHGNKPITVKSEADQYNRCIVKSVQVYDSNADLNKKL